MSDPRQVENRRMGQERVFIPPRLGKVVRSPGVIFSIVTPCGWRMKREGAGAGRAYHGEDEKMTAAEVTTMDDDGEFI